MIDTNHTPYFAYIDVYTTQCPVFDILDVQSKEYKRELSAANCLASPRQQDCLDGQSCSAAPPQAMAASTVSLLGNKAVSTALWLGCNKLQSFLQIFHQVASTKT